MPFWLTSPPSSTVPPQQTPVTDAGLPDDRDARQALAWWASVDPLLYKTDTALDPLETKYLHPPDHRPLLNPTIPDDPTAFRHADTARLRARHRLALLQADASSSRMQRFDECGTHAWLYRSDDPEPTFIVMGSACRDRFCPTCQRHRSSTIAANILRHVAHRNCRFMTLTLQHKPAPLSDRLDTLYESFRNLRSYKAWQQYVAGGVAICEIKRNHKTQTWHVHLHAIVQGRYFPHRTLSALWRAASDGSYVVDIRPIHTQRHLANYITKYLTKPIPTDTLDTPSLAAEVVQALYRRHLAMTFGKWRGLHLCASPHDGNWIPVCSFKHLIASAKAGNPDSIAILNFLWTRDDDTRTHTPGPHQSLDSTADTGLFFNHDPPADVPRCGTGG